VLFLFLGITFVWIIKKYNPEAWKSWKIPRTQIRTYIEEFYEYSHPLFTYAFIGLVVGIFDRWILQYFSGSIEQGFYGLAYQIGAVCFLFTSAMTPLITREFAIAYANRDIQQMAHLFRRYIPMLYGTAAFFSCFIAVHAEKVALIFGGTKFHDASIPITIMAFYPIHQTYGQLSGSVFYATGQTRLYRNIGISIMILGLPVTYLLIAPHQNMGLNLGSTGLAIKMVALQFLGVNVQLYFNAKLLNLAFRKYLAHQLLCVCTLSLVAFVISKAVNYIEVSSNIVVNFLVNGIIYSCAVGIFTYFIPELFGLRKIDIKNIMGKLRK